MRTALIVIFSFAFCACMSAQNQNLKFDQALADSLGADEYGMKSYVLVILKTGDYKPADNEESHRLFRGHLDNISHLAETGKLVVAGPLGENDLGYRGIFIFNVPTVEEARLLLKTDPAVTAGVFDAEIIEWYGSAALPVYLDVHTKIAKVNP